MKKKVDLSSIIAYEIRAVLGEDIDGEVEILRQIGKNVSELGDKLQRTATNIAGAHNVTPEYIDKKRSNAMAILKQAIRDLERMK